MSDDSYARSEWAQRLRDQAEELQDRAGQAQTPEVRLNYLELARSWQKTAARVEDRAPEHDDERDQASRASGGQPPTLTQ